MQALGHRWRVLPKNIEGCGLHLRLYACHTQHAWVEDAHRVLKHHEMYAVRKRSVTCAQAISNALLDLASDTRGKVEHVAIAPACLNCITRIHEGVIDVPHGVRPLWWPNVMLHGMPP